MASIDVCLPFSTRASTAGPANLTGICSSYQSRVCAMVTRPVLGICYLISSCQTMLKPKVSIRDMCSMSCTTLLPPQQFLQTYCSSSSSNPLVFEASQPLRLFVCQTSTINTYELLDHATRNTDGGGFNTRSSAHDPNIS
jgi:hypothetical protein